MSDSYDYLRDPAAIYRQSFATIRREARLDRLPSDIADIAVRMIHACGMTDIVDDLACTDDAASDRARRVGKGCTDLLRQRHGRRRHHARPAAGEE